MECPSTRLTGRHDSGQKITGDSYRSLSQGIDHVSNHSSVGILHQRLTARPPTSASITAPGVVVAPVKYVYDQLAYHGTQATASTQAPVVSDMFVQRAFSNPKLEVVGRHH